MSAPSHQPLESYLTGDDRPPVFCLKAIAHFTPLDINLAFLNRAGWNQSVDRLRFHTELSGVQSDHPLAQAIAAVGPQCLIRRLDSEEDVFVSATISAAGEVTVMSNDENVARRYFEGIFVGCPPSFHAPDEFDISETWLSGDTVCAHFTGMLAGAHGWDPSHNIPPNIQESLDEAKASLEIANYKSSVVMSRRTLEAVMKFGFERLLGRKPVDNKGWSLTLDKIIKEFEKPGPKPIPDHLLHVAHSLRLIGNVPGAHAADVENYQFSRSDAEYALYAVSHFLQQYFSKIDTEVGSYSTITIDLSSPDSEDESTDATGQSPAPSDPSPQ